MPHIFVIFIFSLLSAIWAREIPTVAHATKLVLAPGESVRVHPTRHVPVILSNGKIAKIRELGSDLQITGRAKGQTLVSAGEQSWPVIVLDRERYETFKALQKIVRGMMGLEIDTVAGQVVVAGELLRWRDWAEIKENVGNHAPFQFGAHLSPAVKQEAQQFLAMALQEGHLPMPSLQFEPRALVQIPESAKAELPDYQRLLQPFGVSVEIGHQLVALAPMIRVQIVVAEVKRQQLQHLGIQWPDSLQASLIQPGNHLGLSTSDWVLHALEKNGLGRILASPNLLCRSGKTAEFLAGGEFPVKISNYHIHDVIWKRHGVLLKIQPSVDLAGNMSVALESEVSMVDASQIVDGIPGLFTNRIQSHFDLKRSQTITLSGLIKKDWSHNQEGLPLLSQIPILGALFSSREYQDNQTELIMFVTPEVVTETNAMLPISAEQNDVR